MFSQESKLTLDIVIMELNAMFDKLINNKKLEKRKKKVIMEQLVLLSKLGQNGDQASRDGSEKKKKSKQKLRLKLENVC